MDEEKWFEERQQELSAEVGRKLKSQLMAYEVMVAHRDDPDIIEQLKDWGMPTHLPTVTKVVMLLSHGVLVANSASILLALQPLAPFPRKKEVFEQIWQDLGWDQLQGGE